MPTDVAANVATNADRVLDYLAERGGVAEVAPGRALLRPMAEELGCTRAELIATVAELEADGVIVRRIQDRRVYRVALVDADMDAAAVSAPAPEPAPVPAAWSAQVTAAPAAEPGSSWAPIEHSAPESAPAKQSRFSRRAKPPKAQKAPQAMSGGYFEIREMNNTSFEGIEGKVLSRHKGPKEAFAEIRRLNLQRSGGRYTPRVVVQVNPDGTEDIAIPFNGTRPVHFPYTLSGGRI